MLLLVTILLVLIAAVTLLIGIFGDNLALIFVSIGASALAAIVLAVLSQMSRRKARDATATPTAPEPLAPEPALASTPAAVSAVTPVSAPPPEAPTLTDAPVAAGATRGAATALATLPIADYDSLRVNEILPKLEALDLDQLEEVAQHEESTKNRTTVLNRIDELMDQLEAEEAGAPAVAVVDAASAADTVDDTSEIDGDELAEAIESGDAVPEAAVSGGFPIPDYESLPEAEIIAMLGDLDADELEEVAEYEETHANRDRVLDAIDDRLDELEGLAPAAGAPVAAVATTPVKKVVAKKAATKKAAAKTTAVKTTAVKRAPTPAKRQTSVSKAAISVKKSAAATKSTAKAATKKAAATTKASATKKAASSVKKASAAKKATVAKKATKAAKKSR